MSNRKTNTAGLNSTDHILVLPADVQQTMLIRVDPQSPGVDQQNPDPLNIKEEQEEVWTSPEEEQLRVKEERFTFTAVPLKSEDGEEEPLFCQLHQHQMDHRDVPTSSSDEQVVVETDEEDCGGAGTTRNLDSNPRGDDYSSSETEVSEDEEGSSPDSHLRPLSDSGSTTEDSDKDWKESWAPESGGNIVDKSFSCSECGKQFFHSRSLQRHMTCHPGVKSSSCLAQKKCVRVKMNVVSHRKFQKIPNLFSCDKCGTIFNSETKLNTHRKDHTGEKLFECDVCGKRFNRKTNLNTHTRVHTGEKPFECDICGKRFNLKHHLDTHTRIHTGEKPFVCDVCGQKFSQHTTLNRHMNIHTGQKPCVCVFCGKQLNRKTNLTTHMRIHTGQKSFACDVCGQRFTRKTHLNRHTKVHTGQKSFGCEVCGQKFALKATLERHRRVHTGQKPFACDFCGQRFRHRTSLDRHIRIHTGQKVFACGVCGQRFSRKQSLNKHMKIHQTVNVQDTHESSH